MSSLETNLVKGRFISTHTESTGIKLASCTELRKNISCLLVVESKRDEGRFEKTIFFPIAKKIFSQK
jgi:hypothetical protein